LGGGISSRRPYSLFKLLFGYEGTAIHSLVIWSFIKLAEFNQQILKKDGNHLIPGGLRSYDLLDGGAVGLPLGGKSITARLSLDPAGRLKPRPTTGGMRVLTLVPRIA